MIKTATDNIEEELNCDLYDNVRDRFYNYLNRRLDFNMNIDLDGMLHTSINNELSVELSRELHHEIRTFN